MDRATHPPAGAGKIVLRMAASKAHAVVHFWRGQELGFETRDGATGQLGKLTVVDDLPQDFDAMIARGRRAIIEQSGTAQAEARPKPAPNCIPNSRPRWESPKAKATLDGLPPAQRDYFEWIAEAKQEWHSQKLIAPPSNR